MFLKLKNKINNFIYYTKKANIILIKFYPNNFVNFIEPWYQYMRIIK